MAPEVQIGTHLLQSTRHLYGCATISFGRQMPVGSGSPNSKTPGLQSTLQSPQPLQSSGLMTGYQAISSLGASSRFRFFAVSCLWCVVLACGVTVSGFSHEPTGATEEFSCLCIARDLRARRSERTSPRAQPSHEGFAHRPKKQSRSNITNHLLFTHPCCSKTLSDSV